jgi:hypothetical protein
MNTDLSDDAADAKTRKFVADASSQHPKKRAGSK